MNKTKKNKVIIYILSVIISALFIALSSKYVFEKGDFNFEKEESVILKAVVTEITNKTSEKAMDGENDYIYFKAKIKEGAMKDLVVDATQVNDVYMAVKMKEVEVGDKIILTFIGDVNNGGQWYLGEYLRTDKIIFMGVIFAILLLLFGKFQGLSTLISLAYTCLAVFVILVPSIIGGLNIYFWTIWVSLFIIFMTIILVNGVSRKSLVASIGCVCGVSVSGALSILMKNLLNLTGMTDNDSMFLLMLHSDKPTDLNAIIFASIVIGCVGAVMDVAISMASSLYEVSIQTENPSRKSVLKSGFNIGKDILGTMSNTLILAYIGSSLTIVLLLAAYNTSYLALFNREMIIVEMLQALAGSFGLLLTIPLTSFVASVVYTKADINKIYNEGDI